VFLSVEIKKISCLSYYHKAYVYAEILFVIMPKGSFGLVIHTYVSNGEIIVLYTVMLVLLVLWLLGFLGHIGGAFIHLLLVVALVVFIYNMITGRKTNV